MVMFLTAMLAGAVLQNKKNGQNTKEIYHFIILYAKSAAFKNRFLKLIVLTQAGDRGILLEFFKNSQQNAIILKYRQNTKEIYRFILSHKWQCHNFTFDLTIFISSDFNVIGPLLQIINNAIQSSGYVKMIVVVPTLVTNSDTEVTG